ncbi:hypothetical protein P376_1288 [Streptomyces sp. HCCB10043]|nr:hypothetical protein P376_1288 [Streptomyces sp. HCCB10043]
MSRATEHGRDHGRERAARELRPDVNPFRTSAPPMGVPAERAGGTGRKHRPWPSPSSSSESCSWARAAGT